MKTIRIWQNSIWIPLLLFPFFNLYAQLPLSETQDTKFQVYFFEALKQKAIGNYDKALISLETCQQINPISKAVLFELSKNNLSLNHYSEAEYFIKEALQKDPKNLFLLQHLVKVYKKQQHFGKAIDTYSKILQQQPTKVAPLVQLYLLNGQTDKALKLLNTLETKGLLSFELIKRKNKLEAQLKPKEKSISFAKVSIELFERNKDYKILETLIYNAKTGEKYQDMLEISEMGLQYFPAQPKIYLSKATALNKLSKYNDAIETLEIGLDFVIDNKGLQRQFYKTMIVAYKSINNTKEAKKYQKMLSQ